MRILCARIIDNINVEETITFLIDFIFHHDLIYFTYFASKFKFEIIYGKILNETFKIFLKIVSNFKLSISLLKYLTLQIILKRLEAHGAYFALL